MWLNFLYSVSVIMLLTILYTTLNVVQLLNKVTQFLFTHSFNATYHHGYQMTNIYLTDSLDDIHLTIIDITNDVCRRVFDWQLLNG